MTKLKTLQNKADKLWGQKTKELKDYTCEFPECGANKYTAQIHSHHIENKTRKATRWDIDNCLVLCAKHHTMGQVSAHSTSWSGQQEFHEKMKPIIGEDRLEKLIIKAHSNHKCTEIEMEEIINQLQQ